MQDALGSVQTVLVLGGTSEIAQATCRKLCTSGARRFVLAGRNEAALKQNAEELLAIGAESAEAAHFDACDLAAHPAFVADACRRLGDVDLVLLAFGVLGDQEQLEHDAKAATDLVTANFTGAVSVLVPLADRLREQGHGEIVVLSTVAAERARKSNFVYGSSKAGLDAFATGLGDSLVGTGVRVLVVRPGFVKTKMTEGLEPAPLACTADEVADVIVKAVRSGKETVWAPGTMRFVMSGLRHVPRAVFRKLPI